MRSVSHWTVGPGPVEPSLKPTLMRVLPPLLNLTE
jgi:hypothetical protein